MPSRNRIRFKLPTLGPPLAPEEVDKWRIFGGLFGGKGHCLLYASGDRFAFGPRGAVEEYYSSNVEIKREYDSNSELGIEIVYATLLRDSKWVEVRTASSSMTVRILSDPDSTAAFTMTRFTTGDDKDFDPCFEPEAVEQFVGPVAPLPWEYEVAYLVQCDAPATPTDYATRVVVVEPACPTDALYEGWRAFVDRDGVFCETRVRKVTRAATAAPPKS